MPDLTSLASVKSWLGITKDTDDALLTSLINQVSVSILSFIQRPYLFRRTYTDTITHSGCTAVLKHYPVISVSAVTGNGLAIPAGNGLTCGYWLDADEGMPPGRLQSVNLNGYNFCRFSQITYDAGFYIAGEAQIAAASLNVDAPYGSWAVDGGVSYNGTPFTAVTTAPTTGQYKLGNTPGNYLFASADAGKALLISYSYVPATLEQACMELVGERYRYRDRIGHASKSLGGQESVSFSLADMPPYIKTMLSPFKRMVPL